MLRQDGPKREPPGLGGLHRRSPIRSAARAHATDLSSRRPLTHALGRSKWLEVSGKSHPTPPSVGPSVLSFAIPLFRGIILWSGLGSCECNEERGLVVVC